ncbi:hypothetical protein G9464_00875 [Halostella sp. JP-L12]|uniref:DUF7529 family protein n=1 Tax=Halostella TaxID=1843185 RepID=UPI0013CE6457|nr:MULTISPECIES: hypothetical protein [Halostella]NHN46152.1 hypothetical protein [Halostella sp. JP-L12]
MREADDPADDAELNEPPGTGEELEASADVHKDAWARTIDDMEAMGEELEEEGWDVVTVITADTAPEPPDAGPEGRWGLVHVVPDNLADEFRSAVERGEFPQFDLFRAEAEGRVFHVTQLLDPETETAILIAANFLRRRADGLVRTALEADEMYTHAQTLSGEQLGSFRHDGYEKFFPEADRLVDLDEDRS